MTKGPVPMAELALLDPPLLMFNWPPESVVVPLYVLAPERVWIPLPTLVKLNIAAPDPFVITPEKTPDWFPPPTENVYAVVFPIVTTPLPSRPPI